MLMQKRPLFFQGTFFYLRKVKPLTFIPGWPNQLGVHKNKNKQQKRFEQ